MAISNKNIIKRFTNGKNAEYVYLLEGNIIKKKYSPENKKIFYKELQIMKKLKGYECATQLIDYDKRNFILWMTYCGKKPHRSKSNIAIIKSIAKEIYEKYGLVRIVNGKKSYFPNWNNIGKRKGKIYFFDFGGKNWNIIDK